MLLLIFFAISILINLALSIFLTFHFHKLSETKKTLKLVQSELTNFEEEKNQQAKALNELTIKLETNSALDNLTKLPSRQIFEDRMSQLLSQSKRYNLLFAILSINLDGLKIVNNALGLDAGDALLKEVAKRLLDAIRQHDSASRFVGDDFAVLLAQVVKPESSAYVAQRILESIAKPFQINGEEVFITASVGIAVFPTDGNDTKTLMINADSALRQAKLRGRNGFQFYHKEMYNLSHRELILISSLHSATLYQSFFIYYQPEINSQTKKLACMAAILRWEHPSFGLIEFSELMKFAENSGNMVAIGEWILRNGCEQFRKWQANGFNPEKLSVNISIRQLENPHFIYKLSQILQEMQLNPAILRLELSEISLMAKLTMIGKNLKMLKHLGVSIGISDFGAGNVALKSLPSFEVDSLKIASTLIQDITLNKETAAIVKMIIVLANTLGLDVIAMGVETEEQIQQLKSMGCYLMQGNIFTPPLLPEEFTASLEKVIAERS